jgi:hypothetical protein
VAARDRFDGADIAWLIRATGERLDWTHVEVLMGEHWPVLLWQLLHFVYVFPSEKRLLPADLMHRLLARQAAELDEQCAPLVCRGPMLDPKLYQAEIVVRGAADPRPRRDLVPSDERRRDEEGPPPAELVNG